MARSVLPIATVLFALLAAPARACEAPVCEVPPDSLRLTRVITFDDIPSSPGIGRAQDEVLVLPGARFSERFAGQTLLSEGDFDRIDGMALGPLSPQPGLPGQSLGLMRLIGTTVLHGQGPRGFPDTASVGEGAIAVLFDRDQAAFGFDIRGGEGGSATLMILHRNGQPIHRLDLAPLGEDAYVFMRRGRIADMAGFVLVNTDPEGVSLDNLRFDADELLGRLTAPAGQSRLARAG